MINNIPKRHFYNGKEYKLDEQNKVLILDKDFHDKLLKRTLWGKFGFKKIGGSSVGDVLAVDDYKSQFAAFCRIAWCDMPILNKKYINAGVAIEPMVINALKQVTKKEITTYDPMKYNFDFFSDKDDVVGGIPDGYIESDGIILEIKTTGEKNYENWNVFGVPNGYLKQAQLYSYLMGVEKFWIVATFLKEDDYIDPKNYPIKQRKLKNYKYVINESQVKDDIKKIKEWYEEYTLKGISPQWNEFKDGDLLQYLRCKNQDEYLELLEKWKAEGKFIDED